MQLYFRFVKRPGESHLALDGKKAGSIHNPLSCHRAKQKGKQTKTKNKPQHQQTPKKHTKNQHGRWSADQFIDN
jgi:hypothetical protein